VGFSRGRLSVFGPPSLNAFTHVLSSVIAFGYWIGVIICETRSMSRQQYLLVSGPGSHARPGGMGAASADMFCVHTTF